MCGSGRGIAPPLFTSTLDRGEWSASRPGKEPQGPIWKTWTREKSLFPTGNRSPALQPVILSTEMSPLGVILTEDCKTEALSFGA
jgi:hypothetical protein